MSEEIDKIKYAIELIKGNTSDGFNVYPPSRYESIVTNLNNLDELYDDLIKACEHEPVPGQGNRTVCSVDGRNWPCVDHTGALTIADETIAEAGRSGSRVPDFPGKRPEVPPGRR